MRRLSRPGPPKSSRPATLAVLWGIILAVVAGFGATGFALMHRPPDSVASCRRGVPSEASTVILVDTTDAITEIQTRRLKATIEGERDRLPRGGKLSVLAVNAGDPGDPAELVSVCNPGSAATADPLFETVSKADKRFSDEFGTPIEAALAKASQGEAAASSPIIETIAAALTRPDFDARVSERRLVVVSDLLEYEQGGYSQLKGGDLWTNYVASGLSRRVALDLHGVTVALDYLARPAYARVQGEAHRRFWQRLLGEAGAAEITFIGMRDPEPEAVLSAAQRDAEVSPPTGRPAETRSAVAKPHIARRKAGVPHPKKRRRRS